MKNVLLFIPFLCILNIADAQEKKAMDHSVYEIWNEIKSPMISNNGEFVYYEINPQQGDGRLELYNLKDQLYHTFPRSYGAVITNNSSYLVSKIKAPYDLTRQAKKAKKKKDEYPADSLLIYNLKSRKTEKFEDVRNFQVPKKGGNWMAFHHAYKPETEKDEEKDENEDNPTGKKLDKKFNSIVKKHKLADLVIMNPAKNLSFSYENVLSYAISENGNSVIFHQLVKDSVPNSVLYVFNTNEENLEIIFEGKGLVDKIALDEKGRQSAFIFSDDTTKITGLELYYWKIGDENAGLLVDTLGSGLKPGWGVNRNGKIYFSSKGDRLFFGTRMIPEKEPEDTLLKDEKPSVDVWTWHDTYLQPMQKKRLKNEKNRSYLTLYSVQDKEFIHLGDEKVEDVISMYKGDGDQMIGMESKKYGKLLSWEGLSYKDIYTIDPGTGLKNKVLKRLSSTTVLSPGGKYILYYGREDSTWYAYDIKNKKIRNLTSSISTSFYNEINDVPQLPGSYGYAGFSKNDEFVLIYDRYDIWKIDPSGINPVENLTGGNGKKNFMSYRYIKLDKEQPFIDLDKDLYLYSFNEKTREDGISRIKDKSGKAPEKLLYSQHDYSSFIKARDKDVFIYRKGDFQHYPEIYLAGNDFQSEMKISSSNPQSEDYFWGDARLVSWTSFNGDDLDGILYTPENLDENKKYPMLIYFYERSSQGLYRHRIPSASRSIISIPWCTSNGYIVFVPDIVYRDGYPGASAYDAIVSGTHAMVERYKFIDKENMGLQGQSWGGYQIAYLVTRTNLYKAAMAGAPVSNMTSAYGGIRWASGMSRMFQYEKTQSRIGGTLWDKQALYIENSPVFHAPKVETPLLMMHNDNDGAVPWYQGIEFFVSLRRLNKPVWMLTYNNEEHNLRKWPNRIDLSIRMMQFFDFYLKGEPEPGWMKNGVLQLDKGKKDGYYLLDSKNHAK